MWTEESIAKWKIRSKEIEMDNLFRSASTDEIEEFKKGLSDEEVSKFNEYYKRIWREYNEIASITPYPKKKRATPKAKMIIKINKLIKQIDGQ